MIRATTARTPSFTTVLAEQVRVVSLAARRAIVAAATIIGVPTLWVVLRYGVGAGSGSEQIDLNPAEGYGWITALIGVLLPLAVWKDEDRFGDSQLWLLPVDRRRHALVKVAAGWGVLLAFVAGLGLWASLLTLASGGVIGVDQTQLLLVDRVAAEAGTGGLETVVWSVTWWQWLMPLTAATIAYLFSSALMLATARPWWWVGGFWLAVLTFGLLGGMVDWASTAFEYAIGKLDHPLGVDSVMTGGWDTISVGVTRPDGERLYPWEELPTLGRWGKATLLWMSVGSAGLWAASLRHREAPGHARTADTGVRQH